MKAGLVIFKRVGFVHEEHVQVNELPTELCLNDPRPLLYQRKKHTSRSPRAPAALLPVLQSAQWDADALGKGRLRRIGKITRRSALLEE